MYISLKYINVGYKKIGKNPRLIENDFSFFFFSFSGEHLFVKSILVPGYKADTTQIETSYYIYTDICICMCVCIKFIS